MPFDAMKGLKEALRDREEKHARVSRRELGEEEQAALDRAFLRLEKGALVRVSCYEAFHETVKEGVVTAVSTQTRSLTVGNDRVLFEDVYGIEVL